MIALAALLCLIVPPLLVWWLLKARNDVTTLSDPPTVRRFNECCGRAFCTCELEGGPKSASCEKMRHAIANPHIVHAPELDECDCGKLHPRGWVCASVYRDQM